MPTIRPLPDDLQKIAIAELNEVPERIPADLEALKTWIQQQPHLRARTDDQFLLAFLRGCKFSLEKAKSKIDHYYTLRTKYPDFFTIQDLENPRMRELMSLGVGVHLPIPLNENGPRILLIRLHAYSPEKFSFDEVMSVAHALEEITFMEDDYAVVNGYIDVFDLTGVTAGHFFQATPPVMKRMATFDEKAMPLRQRATHFINIPSVFESAFNLLKPLMPAKQQNRLFIHGHNWEALYKHVPQKYLPKEYGGENGSIGEIIKHNEKTFQKYYDFFKEGLNYGTDEKLRVGKAVDYDDVFGIDGSFRKINVD